MELAAVVGREQELLAQLHALLFLPSSPAPTATPAPTVKVESANGQLPAMIMGNSGGGRGQGGGAAAASSAMATADASSCSAGGQRRRRRHGSKRDRDDDDSKAKDEQHEEKTADAQLHYSPPCKRRKKKNQLSIRSSVTSVPDFDGYQWRKYGQKQIEGAMYPRSYYRCTRSAEQGCAAKRTVQRNDDGGDGATTPKYTVVYVGEHTCTATDSLEAPVILETTAVVPSSAATSTTTKKPQHQNDAATYCTDCIVPSMSAGSCSTATATTTGTESPAISGDDITCWSSTSGASGDYNSYAADDYYCGGLFATGPVEDAAASSLQDMEDLTGPIRSPVHVPAAGCWSIDQLLLQLVNEPVCHF